MRRLFNSNFNHDDVLFISFRDAQCQFKSTVDGFPAYRMCNMWFNSQEMLEEVGGIDPIIMGMTSQIAEKEDAILIPDLRGKDFCFNYFPSTHTILSCLNKRLDNSKLIWRFKRLTNNNLIIKINVLSLKENFRFCLLTIMESKILLITSHVLYVTDVYKHHSKQLGFSFYVKL